MKSLIQEDFIKKAKKIHGDQYDYSEIKYVNKYSLLKIYCKQCKRFFYQTARNHLLCKYCPLCKNFIEKARKIHGDQYDYSEVNYINNKTKVKIYSKQNKIFFWQTPEKHLQGHGYIKTIIGSIGYNKKSTTIEFIKRAKKVHDNKYDYSEVNYINNHTKVKIFCNKCKKYFEQAPVNHLRGMGCSFCQKNRKLTQDEFIEKAQLIHNNRYDYSQVHYINTRTKVNIYCKKCNQYFQQQPNDHLNGNGCPYCKQSKGEIQIEEWLKKHCIEYVAQKRFKNCRDKKSLPFDFYLPKYNVCIEYQGQQHYKEGLNIHFCRYKTKKEAYFAFNLQKQHDHLKKVFCKNNKLYLLEITYKDNITDVLQKFFTLLLLPNM